MSLSASNYVLAVYANGATTVTSTFALTGSVPAGGVFVIAHPLTTAALLTGITVGQSISLNYNGGEPSGWEC